MADTELLEVATELLEVAEEFGGEGSEVVKELLQQLSDHEEPEP